MLTTALLKLIGREGTRDSLNDPTTLTLYQDERRLSPRYHGQVQILVQAGEICSLGTMVDLSAQGARCKMKSTPEIGTDVSVTFQVSPSEFYTVTGKTVRSSRDEIGIRFGRDLRTRHSVLAA